MQKPYWPHWPHLLERFGCGGRPDPALCTCTDQEQQELTLPKQWVHVMSVTRCNPKLGQHQSRRANPTGFNQCNQCNFQSPMQRLVASIFNLVLCQHSQALPLEAHWHYMTLHTWSLSGFTWKAPGGCAPRSNFRAQFANKVLNFIFKYILWKSCPLCVFV